MEDSDRSRLFDIWNLDDVSCSRELLLLLDSPTTGLVSSRVTPLFVSTPDSQQSVERKRSYVVENLEPEFLEPAIHTLSLQRCEEITHEMSPRRSRRSIRCHHCHCESDNNQAHWCTNCGTALIHRGSQGAFNAQDLCTDLDYVGMQLSDDISECSDVHVSATSQSNRNSLAVKPPFGNDKNQVYSSHINTGIPLKTKRSVRAYPRTLKLNSSPVDSKQSRHWNTSSTYMWRKPSTLCQLSNEPQKQPKEKSHKNVYSDPSRVAVPILDLSGITQEDYAVNSIYTLREKIINNKEYKTSASNALLETLPDELLLHIMSFLRHEDLIRCMYVCSRLYIIATDKAMWKFVMLRKKTLTQQDLMFLAHRCPCLKKLTFERCSLKTGVREVDFNKFFSQVPSLKALKSVMNDFGPGTGDRLLLSAATYCSQLSAIEFDWTRLTEKVLQKSIKMISRLESVAIDQHGNISQETLALLFGCHKQWLKVLSIGMGTDTVEKILMSIDGDPLPALHTFSITLDKVDQNIVKHLQKAFPSLKHLFVSYYQLATLPVEISMQLSNLSLHSLHFQLYNELSPLCCKHLSRMGTLRELSIECVDDDGIEVLCSGQLLLEVLDISNSLVTELSFLRIAMSSFCLVLKYLKLNGCMDIKKADKAYLLLERCSRLQVIEMNKVPCAMKLWKELEQMNNSCKVIFQEH